MPFYSFLPIFSVLYEASEGAKLSLQKLIDISLSLESAIKHVAVIQNEFKHPNEAVSKIEQKSPSTNYSAKRFRFNNLYDPKLWPFKDKNVYLNKIKGHTLRVCRKNDKLLLLIKQSSIGFQCNFGNYLPQQFRA